MKTLLDAVCALAVAREIEALDRAYDCLRGFTTTRLEAGSTVVVGELMLDRGERSSPDITLSAANAVPIIAGLMIAVKAERSLLIAKLEAQGFAWDRDGAGNMAATPLRKSAEPFADIAARRSAEGRCSTDHVPDLPPQRVVS